MIVSLLKRFVAELPSFTIRNQHDGTPYLTRWYVWPRGRQGESREIVERDTPFGVYVHFFHRGDKDRDPHNHPWDHSVSIVLAGGYTEERDGVHRTFKPGDINTIGKDDFHRVTLLDEKAGSWSLFIAGRRVQVWGFRRDDGVVIPWKEYLGMP
jgi:hypothetical protein